MTLSIDLQKTAHKKARIPSKKTFQSWALQTLKSVAAKKKYAKQSHLCIRIVDKKESAHLNERFRNKKGPTNVLSFGYDHQAALLGDLAICAELVKEEANQQQKTMRAHWAHLTVHGILHLLGYDHVKLRDAKKMEALEIVILDKLGYSNPYGVNG